MNTESQMPPMDGVPPNMNVPPMDGVPPTMDGTVPPTNALSLYGQDAGVEDFPVLKAFQQYIDAEQSKSRKRMIMLSMFFGVLMTILVAVFVLLLAQMNHDKQSANDKLVEFLMRERERSAQVPVQQPVVPPVANAANDAALKAVTDTLTALQKQIADDRAAALQREREAARRAAEVPLPAVAPAQSATRTEADRVERDKAVEKLKKANALLKAERRKIEAEKAKLKEEKIEAYRRKHYPELYAPVTPLQEPTVREVPVQDKKVQPQEPVKRPSTSAEKPQKKAPVKATQKTKTAPATKQESVAKPVSATSMLNADDEPIEYYSEDNSEYSIDLGDELDVSIGL